MNHKRFLSIGTAMPLAACAVLMFGACSGKKSNDNISASNSKTIFATDSISWNDSVATPAGNKANYDITVEWPKDGNPELLSSVRSWIANKLTVSPSGNPDDTISAPLPADCLTNGKKLLSTIGTRTLTSAKKELSEYDSLKMPSPMGYEYLWKITDLYQTDKFVTYGALNYVYLGGAHGGTSFAAQVFRLDDGKQFGWDMFQTDSLPRLKTLIKEGLMSQYFEVKTESQFKDALLINPDTLPLPASAPYFMPKGVNFDYQQYEIAPYAAGMPSCVLPYSVVKPMLTPEAAKLLPTD